MLLWLPGGTACERESDLRPSAVLVVFDTTRADHTSLAGYARDTTPQLRDFAGEGASFEVAYAPTSTTGPTHATLFTGLSPLRHDVTNLLVRENVGLGQPRETLDRHAVEAPEVAAVGDRDPQILDAAFELVLHRACLPAPAVFSTQASSPSA